MKETDQTKNIKLGITPLNDQQVDQGWQALNTSQKLQEEILKRRQGKVLDSSWELIREQREQRSKNL